MIRPLFFVATLAIVSFTACKNSSEPKKETKTVDVKTEVEQTAKSLEDSTGKVDVQKMEQMMEDAK